MKASRLVVLVIVVIMIGIAFQLYNYNRQEQFAIPFVVSVATTDGEQSIFCWMNDQEDYFVFVPAYCNLSDLQIHENISAQIYINGVAVQEGMFCDAFALNTPYQMLLQDWLGITERKITFVQSANVSTAFIETKSGDTRMLHSNKEYKEEAVLSIYRSDGTIDYSGKLRSISGRGNVTWELYDKKPYSVELAEEVSLLNMGEAQKWIFLANATDPSNLRNKLALTLAQELGLEFSPDAKWVDLFLNGEYVGLYLLCEKNEVHKQRVAISMEDSFLVSVELETRLISQGIPHVVTDAKQALRIHYPAKASDYEKTEVLSYMQSVENALLSENGVDPQTGKVWNELIDIDSWAKKYLLEEVIGNWDAGYISQFFYKDGVAKEEKVYAGPAWDYDRTFGNTSWQFQNTNALYAQRLNVKGKDETPWFHKLYQKTEFFDRMVCLYREELIPALNQLMDYSLNEYAEYIATSHQMDHVRWGENNEIGEEVAYIRSYLSKRMEFLSDIWINGEKYYVVQADPGFNQFYAYIAVKSGEQVEGLRQLNDTSTSRFLGWYYMDTDEPFDVMKPIYEDTVLCAKWHGIPSWWQDQLIEVVPMALFSVMWCCLFVVFIKRIRKEMMKK